jgi:hypothetical protein
MKMRSGACLFSWPGADAHDKPTKSAATSVVHRAIIHPQQRGNLNPVDFTTQTLCQRPNHQRFNLLVFKNLGIPVGV